MKNEHKYIIVKQDEFDGTFEYAIIFPKEIIHKHVARIHRAGNVRVVSAGFCKLGETCEAYGESESLRMQSRPEVDAIILTRDYGYTISKVVREGKREAVGCEDCAELKHSLKNCVGTIDEFVAMPCDSLRDRMVSAANRAKQYLLG